MSNGDEPISPFEDLTSGDTGASGTGSSDTAGGSVGGSDTATPGSDSTSGRPISRTPGQAPVVSAHAPHARITVSRPDGRGGSIVLRRVAAIVGSRPGCKVLLKHPQVSGVHCAIVNTGGEIFVRDLLSRQGTFLNDLKAEHERIDEGDVISVRPWKLRVNVMQPDLDDSSDVTGLGLEPAPAVIALEEVGTKRVRQLSREVNLLGRKHGCDVVIEDRSVSRAHCLIFMYLSKVVVFDLMSQNETLVNGQAITFAKLKHDDLLSLGSVDLRVRLVEPSPKLGAGSDGAAQAPTPDGSFSDRIDIRAAEMDRFK